MLDYLIISKVQKCISTNGKQKLIEKPKFKRTYRMCVIPPPINHSLICIELLIDSHITTLFNKWE